MWECFHTVTVQYLRVIKNFLQKKQPSSKKKHHKVKNNFNFGSRRLWICILVFCHRPKLKLFLKWCFFLEVGCFFCIKFFILQFLVGQFVIYLIYNSLMSNDHHLLQNFAFPDAGALIVEISWLKKKENWWWLHHMHFNENKLLSNHIKVPNRIATVKYFTKWCFSSANARVTIKNTQIAIGMPIKFEVFPRFPWDPLIRFWFGGNGTTSGAYPSIQKKNFQNPSTIDGVIGEHTKKRRF